MTLQEILEAFFKRGIDVRLTAYEDKHKLWEIIIFAHEPHREIEEYPTLEECRAWLEKKLGEMNDH